jgi:hypothetical protein
MAEIRYDLSEYEEDGVRISLALASSIVEEGYQASVDYDQEIDELVVEADSSSEELESFMDDLLQNL